MIYVRLEGGLGNQLFQYAYGRALSLAGKEVTYDVSLLLRDTKYTKRMFSLPFFALYKEIKITEEYHPQTLFKKIINRLDIDRKVRYVKPSLDNDTYVADGYYNSEKYFLHIREALLKEVCLKEKSEQYLIYEKKILEAKNPLVIHARRGDYLASSLFTQLGPEYYKKALESFDKDCEIFCFSDDPLWLLQVIDRSCTMVSGQGLTDYEELILMSRGTNFIIANSTFSWWGAWLSTAVHKKVIAPKKWFTSAFWWRANRDIVPENWTRI